MDRNYILSELQKEAKKGTCMRKQVGAIAIKKGRIIAKGHSRSIKNRICKGYERIEGTKLKRAHTCLHAEQNMVRNAKTSLKGAIVYVTLSCCIGCLALLTDLGVKEVYFTEKYSRVYAEEIYEELIPMIEVSYNDKKT